MNSASKIARCLHESNCVTDPLMDIANATDPITLAWHLGTGLRRYDAEGGPSECDSWRDPPYN